MRRTKNRALALVLTILCVWSFSLQTVTATDEYPIEPYYIGLAQVTVSLDINDTALESLANCFTFVRLYDGYSADVTLNLQRSTDKSNWTTIKSWEDSGEGQIEISKNYFVNTEYYHRVGVLIYVYYENGNVAEIITKYSPIQP